MRCKQFPRFVIVVSLNRQWSPGGGRQRKGAAIEEDIKKPGEYQERNSLLGSATLYSAFPTGQYHF